MDGEIPLTNLLRCNHHWPFCQAPTPTRRTLTTLTLIPVIMRILTILFPGHEADRLGPSARRQSRSGRIHPAQPRSTPRSPDPPRAARTFRRGPQPAGTMEHPAGYNRPNGASSRFLEPAVALLDASGRAGEPVVIVMVVVVVVVTGRTRRWDFLAPVLISGSAGSLGVPAAGREGEPGRAGPGPAIAASASRLTPRVSRRLLVPPPADAPAALAIAIRMSFAAMSAIHSPTAPLPVARLLQMYKPADRNLRQLREDPAAPGWLR